MAIPIPVRFGNKRKKRVPGDYIEMIDECGDREGGDKTGSSPYRAHDAFSRGHCGRLLAHRFQATAPISSPRWRVGRN
jgi:hypothetical protein